MDGKYYTSNAHDKRYNFNYLVVKTENSNLNTSNTRQNLCKNNSRLDIIDIISYHPNVFLLTIFQNSDQINYTTGSFQ